jgi:hypothetical protein
MPEAKLRLRARHYVSYIKSKLAAAAHKIFIWKHKLGSKIPFIWGKKKPPFIRIKTHFHPNYCV